MDRKDWFRFFAPRFVLLAALMGFVLRIVLLLMPGTVREFSFWDWPRIFGVGLLNDVCFALVSLVPAFLV